MSHQRYKRSRLDIEFEILSACKSPMKKTPLMYKAKLSFELAKKYLGDLQERDLLNYDGLTFHTTRKGLDYLEKLQEWKNKSIELTGIAEDLRKFASTNLEDKGNYKGEKHQRK
ncbi:winged helix-turn-helix domain-containing protein [Saccharolobus solfataricus]|uniref:ArnR1-like winged helix-turn-helix domain-containing protein n=1 Tax=Saccharolobus solfataricus TaxID=2287 RepID=A0A7S9NSJ3_SACSO|nr:winged helix-turn-helix domain-containing protein [Saccharolobus solfataricus]QPG51179.1 hypothetical protein HFC64_16315 [Saccharolobus solfataricus]